MIKYETVKDWPVGKLVWAFLPDHERLDLAVQQTRLLREVLILRIMRTNDAPPRSRFCVVLAEVTAAEVTPGAEFTVDETMVFESRYEAATAVLEAIREELGKFDILTKDWLVVRDCCNENPHG